MVYRKRRRKFMDAHEVMREMGRRGGRARAKNMTPEERREGAIIASKAAAKARKARAKAKKKEKTNPNSKYICDMLIEKRKDGGGK